MNSNKTGWQEEFVNNDGRGRFVDCEEVREEYKTVILVDIIPPAAKITTSEPTETLSDPVSEERIEDKWVVVGKQKRRYYI